MLGRPFSFVSLVFAAITSSALGGCSWSLGLDELDVDPVEATGGQGGGGGRNVAGGAAAGAGGRGGVGGAAGKAGQGGVGGASGKAGQGGVGGSAGGSGVSGQGASGGLAGASGGSGASGQGAAGSVGVAGKAGAAGTSAGIGGAAGGSGTAGAAGAGGTAGAAGSGGVGPTCPTGQNVARLHEVSDPADLFLDLDSNGTSLVFVTQMAGGFFVRGADLSVASPGFRPISGFGVRAARLRSNDVVVFGSDRARVVALDGQQECASDALDANVIFAGCDGARLYDVDDRTVATTGCVRQIVGTVNATAVFGSDPKCGSDPFVDVGKGAGDIGSADEVLGMALRNGSLFTVDVTGDEYRVQEKAWPEKKPTQPAFTSGNIFAKIADGLPRGLAVTPGFVFTSVQSATSGGKWDLRRYAVGQNDARTVMHAGIEGLEAFTVSDGRLYWATSGPGGARFWRGGFAAGGAQQAAELIACGPVAPAQFAVTSNHLFWSDLTSPGSGNRSIRGVALPP